MIRGIIVVLVTITTWGAGPHLAAAQVSGGDHAQPGPQADADVTEIREYIARCSAVPASLEVPARAAAAMMGRAQSWLARYGTQKIQTATEYVVETYDASGKGWPSFSCRVVRTPGDHGKDRVEVTCNGMFETVGAATPQCLMLFMRDQVEPPLQALRRYGPKR